MALIVIACAFVLRLATPTRTERFVEYATKRGWTSKRFVELTSIAASIGTIGTQFERRWHINQPLDSSAINIYVIEFPAEMEVPEDFRPYLGNLAYTGELNAIVLDAQKILALINDSGLLPPEQLTANQNPFVVERDRPKQTMEVYRVFFTWIIGHEIGHIISNHKAGHFSADGSDVFPSYDEHTLELEYEADRFLAEKLSAAKARGSISDEEVSQISTNLILFMEAEYRRRVGAPVVSGPLGFLSQTENLAILPSSTHPEFFLRAGRLLATIDTPDRPIFSARVPQLERQLLNPSTVPGLLVVEGDPVAGVWIGGADAWGDVGSFATPVRQWLAPGDYRLTIQASGYQSTVESVRVAARKHHEVEYHLIPDPAQAVSERVQSAEGRSEADRAVSLAWRYYAVEPLVDAALWELERAERLAPSWSLPILLMAHLAAEKGNFEEARQLWGRGLSLWKAEPFWCRFNMAYEVLELDEVEARIEEEPGNRDLLVERIEQLWRLDLLDEAEERIHELPDEMILSPNVRFLKSLILRDRGRLEEALTLLDDLVLSNPTLTIGSWSASTRSQRASVREELGLISEAETDFEAVAVGSTGSAASNPLALARFYRRQDRVERAAEAYKRALSTFEADEEEKCEFVEILLDLNNEKEADEVVQKYGLHDVEYCRLSLGRFQLQKRNFKSAADLCQVDPKTAEVEGASAISDALQCQAEALLGIGDLTRAVEAYRQATWLEPLNAELRRRLAAVEGAEGFDGASECGMWMADRVESVLGDE